jgi:hypothetical protein
MSRISLIWELKKAKVETNPISEINQIIHTVPRTVAIPSQAVSILLERKSIGITVN